MLQQADRVLSGWNAWSSASEFSSPPQLLWELPGGRTNHSYLIRFDGVLAVLRINAADSSTLGIDRCREQRLHTTAAAAGLAPRLLYCDPAYQFSITEYIEGRQWRWEDLEQPKKRRQIRELVARVQALPLIVSCLDYCAYVERYWTLVQGRDPGILAPLRERQAIVMPAIISLQHSPWQPVVAHHDLNPENIIERDGRLFLLDWEYAAGGHPDIDRLLVDRENVDPRVVILADWINVLWELLHG